MKNEGWDYGNVNCVHGNLTKNEHGHEYTCFACCRKFTVKIVPTVEEQNSEMRRELERLKQENEQLKRNAHAQTPWKDRSYTLGGAGGTTTFCNSVVQGRGISDS